MTFYLIFVKAFFFYGIKDINQTFQQIVPEVCKKLLLDFNEMEYKFQMWS